MEVKMKKNLFGLLLSVAMLASCNPKNPESSSQPSSVTSSSSTSVESSSSSKVEEKVTVTFDADNGVLKGPASLSVKKGEKIDQSQIPTASKDKHAFRFWAKRGETTAFDFNSVITDNLELIAIYQADTFTITYEGLKGSETHNNRTSYSSDTPTFTLQKPAFNREGYEFDSWRDEEGRPISSVIKGSTGNRRFTASFKVINYTITYKGLEGTTNSNSNPTSYNVEKETFMLSNPSRSGYTFTGWEDRGLKVTYISKGTTGNLTLTATWDANAYSITYENVEEATNPNPVSYSVTDKSFTLLPATKKGYTFKHWEESGVMIESINPSESRENKVLKAVWEPISYSISYQLSAGQPNPSNLTKYTIEETVQLFDPLNIPVGYKFTGWTLNGKTVDTIPQGTTGNLILIANFDVDSYTISYEGLNGESNTNPTSYKADSETIQLVNPGLRNGYTFTGWTLGGKKVTSIPAGTTGNLKLTATWDADAHSITYQNVEGAINPNPVSYKTGESVAFNSPTKKGYDFVKWVDGNNNDLTKLPVDSTGNKVLKAVWEPISYSISYQSSAGDLNLSNPTEYTIEQTVQLHSPSNTPAGYKFAGWTLNGETVDTIPQGTTGDITLVATWTPIEYNITYKGIDGLNNNNNPKTYNYESTIIFQEPASKEGYKFAGWLGSDNQLVTHINPSTITGDIVLTASWQPRTYSITYKGVDGVTHSNSSSYTIETDTITLQDPTERKGYTFTGWVDEKDQPIKEIGKGSTGDRVITAKWNVVTYTITYNGLEGATHSNPTSYTIETDTITLQNPSARDGFDFAGWLGSDGQKVTEITKGSTGNKVFTATWRYYTITYIISDDDIKGADWDSRTLEYTPNDVIILPTVSNPNLTFKGWKIRTSGGTTLGDFYSGQIAAGTLTGDIELVPYYVATVIFMPYDGQLEISEVLGDYVDVTEEGVCYREFEIVENGATLELGDDVFVKMWYTDEQGEHEIDTKTFKVTENITLRVKDGGRGPEMT